MENRLLTNGSARFQLSSNGRYCYRYGAEQDHKDDLIAGLDANTSATRKISAISPNDSLKKMKNQTDLAAMEIQAVPPTAGERFRRYLLQKTVGAVGFTVLDARAKQADTMIQRMTEQRVRAAEAQLEKTTSEAASVLSERLQKSNLSVAYLQTKSQVTEELIGKLNDQMSKLENMKTEKMGNKGVLQQQIKNLSTALQNSKLIGSKTQEQIGKTETAGLLAGVENADKYFEKLFSIHAPESSKDLQGWIAEYAIGNKSELEHQMYVVAHKMHDGDTVKERAQVNVMKRVAEGFLGKEQAGSWRWMYRRLKDIAPSSAIGLAASLTGNLATGGIAGAALIGSLVTRYAYNRYNYGAKSKSDWEGAQIAGYFTNKADKSNGTQLKMFGEQDTEKRIALLKELPVGAKINILKDGKNAELTIASSTDLQVFATDGRKKRFAFDLKGSPGGSHYLTYIVGREAHNMRISSSADALFSVSEPSDNFSTRLNSTSNNRQSQGYSISI